MLKIKHLSRALEFGAFISRVSWDEKNKKNGITHKNVSTTDPKKNVPAMRSLKKSRN